jgi:hypothetical protein
VGYVEVATEDDGLLGVERLQVGLEIGFPAHAIVEALQSVL